MLSEQERKEIEKEAGLSVTREQAVSECLMILQESRGWVSDEGIADIADALRLSREEVDSIATFFELVFRRPVGRHVILVCDSVSCCVTGGGEMARHVAGLLGVTMGGTTADGSFTLLPAGCLGVCEQAPAMMIDGEIFGNLTPERAREVISRYRSGADGSAAHR